MRGADSPVFDKCRKKKPLLPIENNSIRVKVVMVINLLFCWHDLKAGADVLCLEANFRVLAALEQIYVCTSLCTRQMFVCRLCSV